MPALPFLPPLLAAVGLRRDTAATEARMNGAGGSSNGSSHGISSAERSKEKICAAIIQQHRLDKVD